MLPYVCYRPVLSPRVYDRFSSDSYIFYALSDKDNSLGKFDATVFLPVLLLCFFMSYRSVARPDLIAVKPISAVFLLRELLADDTTA